MGNQLLFSLIGFILAIGILVTVHEFGHFWVARRMGVKVLKFSVGFGPPLWSRVSKLSGTEYVVAVIPLGGYVKMLDESEAEVDASEKPFAFSSQPPWKRMAIVVAGPAFNFLFAIIAYFLVFAVGMSGVRPIVGGIVEQSPAFHAGIAAGDEIIAVNGRPNRSWGENQFYLLHHSFSPTEPLNLTIENRAGMVEEFSLILPAINNRRLEQGWWGGVLGVYPEIPRLEAVISKIEPNSPADIAGILPGDRITAVNGEHIDSWQTLVNLIRSKADSPIMLYLERQGTILQIEAIPEKVMVENKAIGRLGIQRAPFALPESMQTIVQYNPLLALWRGIENTWYLTAITVRMVGLMLSREVDSKNISGPIAIAQFAGESAQAGTTSFLLFLCTISISLGILNLLPIPILDGGHLLYILIEVITGKEPSINFRQKGQAVGLILLLSLMMMAFYNDILRLLG